MSVKVFLANTQRIYGLTGKQKQELRARLTVENPAYINAARFSRWGPPKRIPRYLTFYEERGNCFEVPLHFELPMKHIILKDLRVSVPVKWPELKVTLHPGQREPFEAYLSNPENGQVIIDTGEGKTILSYAIAAALGQKMLVLVDRQSYSLPWFKDFKKAFGSDVTDDDIGLIKGEKFKIGRLVTVAFVQTLYNRLHDPKYKWLTKHFGIVVHDEADTAAAPTRYWTVSQFWSKYRLAVSGTIKRSDGMQFLNRYVFGDFAANLMGKGKRILRGDQVNVVRVETGFKVARIPMRWTNPITDDDEEEAVVDFNKLWDLECKHPVANAVKLHYICQALDRGEPCLVLTHRKSHAEMFALELGARGYSVRLLTGDTPDELKDKIIEQANRGKVQCVVSTFQYIKRGANVPNWTHGFALTQTSNETELRQAIGRIRRVHTEYYVVRRNGKIRIEAEEKKSCTWYDFIAMSVRPYKVQAMKRLRLWQSMGFNIINKTAPPEIFEG